MPAPFDLGAIPTPVMYGIYLVLGVGFGAALEMAGFGRASKLAAQFYFKDFAMFKVMFTAVITAMVLVFGASAVGLLDFRAVFVDETYLWPGIIGGFILGVGFLIGGLCPGTSLVGVATFKIDALFFVGGTVVGVFLFGETVPYFMEFWEFSYMGRFTIPDWLGIDTGLVVLIIVVMALGLFWGVERIEKKKGIDEDDPPAKGRYVGAGVLVMLALVVLAVGQPDTKDYWDAVAAEEQVRLEAREVQIDPGELLDLMNNNGLNLVMLDVRSVRDYNQFHLRAAKHFELDELAEGDLAAELIEGPSRTVVVAMSNAETSSTEAWKALTAQNVQNAYILEGGVNGWLAIFGEDADPKPTNYPEQSQFVFTAALGDRCVASDPDAHEWELEYTPKVQLAEKQGPSTGGCG
jgi:hypothetical protein